MNPRIIAKVQILGSDFINSIVDLIDPSTLPEWAHGTCSCKGGCIPEGKKFDLTKSSVPAGQTFVHEILVSEPSTLSWLFLVNTKDIDFEVQNMRDNGEKIIVSEKNRYFSGARIDGFVKVEPGKVLLIWDNSHAYWTTKEIEFFVSLQKEIF